MFTWQRTEQPRKISTLLKLDGRIYLCIYMQTLCKLRESREGWGWRLRNTSEQVRKGCIVKSCHSFSPSGVNKQTKQCQYLATRQSVPVMALSHPNSMCVYTYIQRVYTYVQHVCMHTYSIVCICTACVCMHTYSMLCIHMYSVCVYISFLQLGIIVTCTPTINRGRFVSLPLATVFTQDIHKALL